MQNRELKKKSETLLNCPFCGGEAKVYDGQVVCTNCWSGSACENTTEKAIEKWNTRKPIDKIVEELEKKAREPMYQHHGESYYIGVEEAIEIVKGGGKK